MVQKNNLKIFRAKGGRSFVGHSKELTQTRDLIMREMFSQYEAYGYLEPIHDYLAFDFKFYVTRQAEPDLDNLPAIILDALQGKVMKRKAGDVRICQVISNDKTVRSISSEKIVKGDPSYDGEPRTEFTISRYSGCDIRTDAFAIQGDLEDLVSRDEEGL